jgi:tetratricopeptide (TPR) repeat protein
VERIGPYSVVRELARGGMGAVYEARAPQGQPVAIKVLLSVTAAQQARLQREGQALLRLQHPNVVRVHEVGQDRGRPFLVMDLVEGETLQARLDRQGPLRPRVAADLARRLALALEHAHARGVVHRDLKPGNIILQAITGEPLLTDFGLARPLEEGATRLTQSGVMLGTLGFAAPEQLVGDVERVGPAADIWGLGATLYAALCGSAPFEGQSAMEVVIATQERAARPPSDNQKGLPPALEAICLRCLEKDPAARVASATELASALADWLASERPAAARRRAIVAIAIALVAGGLALGAGLWLAPPSTPPPVATTTIGPPAPPAPPPDDAAATRRVLARAHARLDAGDQAGALTLLDEAVSRAPRDAGVWALRAGVRLRHGDAAGALADAEQALTLDPDNVDALINRGAVRGESGDVRLAIVDLERAVALAPLREPAWNDLANAYGGAGELDRALEAAERAVTLAPDSAAALATRGWVLSARGETARARVDLNRALELDPKDAGAWLSRGLLRVQENDLAGALGDWTRAAELDPTNVEIWNNRSSARMASGDFAGAIADATRALELVPDTYVALFNRGIARKNLRELDGADADLTRAISVRPERGAAYYHRGVVRLLAGGVEAARADGARAATLLEAELGPTHPATVRAVQLRDDPARLRQ